MSKVVPLNRCGLEGKLKQVTSRVYERMEAETFQPVRLFGFALYHKQVPGPLPEHVVMRAIREAMNAANLRLESAVTKVHDNNWIVQLSLKLTITDVDSGESRSTTWAGESPLLEKHDRIGAAVQNATSSYLRNLFLVLEG